jgi:outer membrane protein
MNTLRRIISAFLPLALCGCELLAQNPSPELPNSPTAQPLLLASAQLATPPDSSLPSQTEPILLPLQQAEKIALANDPRIHISQLIAKVQHQAIRERRADELPP